MSGGAPASRRAPPGSGNGRCSGIIPGHRPPRLEEWIPSSCSTTSTGTPCPTGRSSTSWRRTPSKGLDRFAVEHRRAQFGLNQLTPPKGPGPLRRFAHAVHRPARPHPARRRPSSRSSSDEWVDAIVIFGVVLLNAIVGYLQEAKAVAAIDALSRAMTAEATVLRGRGAAAPPRHGDRPRRPGAGAGGRQSPGRPAPPPHPRPAGGRVRAHRRVGARREGPRQSCRGTPCSPSGPTWPTPRRW